MWCWSSPDELDRLIVLPWFKMIPPSQGGQTCERPEAARTSHGEECEWEEDRFLYKWHRGILRPQKCGTSSTSCHMGLAAGFRPLALASMLVTSVYERNG